MTQGRIILFEHANFEGNTLDVQDQEARLDSRGFNDQTSSFVILSGQWAFYRDVDFNAPYTQEGNGQIVLGPGMYPTLDSTGISNDDLSSLRLVGAGGQPAGPEPGGTARVVAEAEEEVGNLKYMRTQATLYRNGHLEVSAYTKSSHWSEGLRGRVVVVCVDSIGQATWVSPVLECTTRGSKGDLFTASAGTDPLQANFPKPVGKYTCRLDIHQGDAGSRDWTAARDAIVTAIKEAEKIADEVKPFLEQL